MIENKKKSIASILVRNETSPDDVEGMYAAEGILTARGGMTSHAAGKSVLITNHLLPFICRNKRSNIIRFLSLRLCLNFFQWLQGAGEGHVFADVPRSILMKRMGK